MTSVTIVVTAIELVGCVFAASLRCFVVLRFRRNWPNARLAD